jgi:3-oxoacyl-(acyl-carrier-protein) synthase
LGALTVPRQERASHSIGGAAAFGHFDVDQWVLKSDSRAIREIDFINWGVAASELALRSAGLLDRGVQESSHSTAELVNLEGADAGSALLLPESLGGYSPWRVGTAIGTGIGCVEEVGRAFANVEAGRRNRVSPFFVPRILANMAAGQAAIRFGLQGPLLSSATACASAAHSIGDAFR